MHTSRTPSAGAFYVEWVRSGLPYSPAEGLSECGAELAHIVVIFEVGFASGSVAGGFGRMP